MKTPTEILIAARARIADPAHWTTGHFAVDERGSDVHPRREEAVCFCALGALTAVMEPHPLRSSDWSAESAKANNFLYEAVGPTSGIVDINDGQGHEAVLALYDRAIELSKAAPATKS